MKELEPKTAREALMDLHLEICASARDLMALKNQDYASAQDPFRNFRIYGLFGVLVRMQDKLSRLLSFLENGSLQVKEEAVDDTLKDIINYSVLFKGMLDESKRPRG